MSPRIRRRPAPLLITALVFLSLYAGAAVTYKGFFSWFQFTQLFADNASLGLAAIGVTFVILSGGIDLSVGALIALTSMIFAGGVMLHGVPLPLSLLLTLFAGTVFGASMGLVIHFFRLPPFIVTLSGMFLARGAALALTAEKRIAIGGSADFQALASFSIAGFSLPALVFMGALLCAAAIAHWTRFGRTVYAIGGNESSARLMGLAVASTKIRIYALSGCFAAAGGIVHVIGTQAGDASVGFLLELDAIAAVVIGGTVLAGGRGTVLGTLLGVLILGVITLLPSYQGNLNSWWTRIAIGGLLLAFILFQRALQGARGFRPRDA